MTGRGRPLRFLALVAAGWVGVRAAILWPGTGSPPPTAETRIRAVETGRPVRPRSPPIRVPTLLGHSGPAGPPAPRAPISLSEPVPALPIAELARTEMAVLDPVQYGVAEIIGTGLVRLPEVAQPVAIAPMPPHWSASAWLVVRPGMGLGAAPGAGQLGGSQAGLRMSYPLSAKQRIAAFARIAAPLAGKGAEGAVGLDWQPLRAPVRLVAEQRFGLDGTRGGAGLGVITGIYMQAPADFTLEAYGQAGAIRRARIEPYADGAARMTRIVAASGRVRLALGGGAWGAAQRDAQRLDLGPSATFALPIGGRSVRLALDWRQRVAGNVRPGSGGALTIGSDF